ncbi:MAG: HIT family protein [Burkholderiales bacterium]|uniref:HIT family protein n=1 Tax=Inhella sp. TaxID=1921806 RepID=UPI001AC7F849|nr:HIT family protein [Burkholderiales bacterium]
MSEICPLCQEDGGLAVYREPLLRVVRVLDTPAHPAFYRVVLNRHVAEFSQLPVGERMRLMEVVAQVEALLLRELQPVKLNLASLGNVVPHLHWHVVARFADDAQFPAPIWANAVREREPAALAELAGRLPAMDRLLAQALGEST